MEKDGKTEKPTPKRLRDSRKKGDVAKSVDLVIAFSILAFAFLIKPFMLFILEKFIPYLKSNLISISSYETIYLELPSIFFHAITLFFLLGMPFYILAIILGILTNLLQVGFLFSWQTLKPDFKRLNFLTNFKQMFGVRSLMNTLKILAKLMIVIYFCYQLFLESLPKLMNTSTIGTRKTLLYILDFAHAIFLKVAIFLVILSILDFIYQKYSYTKKLKMSKQEIKDEYKQMEGDPKIKAQRKAQYRAMMRNAIAHVKEATVVITNPTHFAVAIRYNPVKDDVPIVLAKGTDILAQKMKDKAKKHHIPMIENKPVARALYAQVEPGQPIPIEMYEALAEIIATVQQLEEAAKGKI